MDKRIGRFIYLNLQIHCWSLLVLVALVTCQVVKDSDQLNECDRGVKRHHPSQANLYQIFTRKDYRKQWLDYACPEYMIFDPRTCECAETQRPTEPQVQVTPRNLNKGPSPRQQSSSSRRDIPPSTQYSERPERPQATNKGKSISRSSPQQNSWGSDSKQESTKDAGSQDGKRSQGDEQGRSWSKRENVRDADEQDNSYRDSGAGGRKQERAPSTGLKQGGWSNEEVGGWDKRDNSLGKSVGGWAKQEVISSKQSGRPVKGTDSEWDNNVIPSLTSNKQISDDEDIVKKQDGSIKKSNSWDRGNLITEPTGQRVSGGDCHLHRPSSENPSHFERWADGKWIQEDCNWPFYTGLVWSQASCRCEWGPNRTHVTPMSGDSVPAACLMMLKISFDGGNIVDEGRHIWLNIKDKENAMVEADKTAVGGKCGSFRGSSIAIPYFKSNVLGATFHIGFMFKLCAGDPDTDIPLLHNDCIESPDPPGIVIVYQAWKRRVVISMRNMDSEELISEYCAVDNTQTQWVKLDIRYSDNLLEVTANNEMCISSEKYIGPVATNNCPLTLLGEAFCGKLDEVTITRGCTQAHAVS